jgi:threonyl-tRNA synthetase
MSGGQIELELPDGTRIWVTEGTTSLAVAREIGPGLGKAALAAKLNGQLIDLRVPLREGGAFSVITARDPEGSTVIRHSAEHVMADAVKRIWPETQIDVGRSDHSEKFQYDFDVPVRLTPDDLEKIESEMGRIIAEGLEFRREVVTREEASELFGEMGEELKVSRLEDIPEGEDITVYRHGGFVDLCRGPHVQNSKQIGAWKLTELAGSYWRGDERNPMLQRIYGVAFVDRKELGAYLKHLEEAKERDHRRLGAELDLFQFHEWAPGAPFYLPKGLTLYHGLIDYIRSLYPKYGYREVMCPQVFAAEVYKTSGHWDNFRDEMFTFDGSDEGDAVGLKPMNCPGHCLIFRSGKRSYRELPLRFAEFSRLHRNERSGTLHGLSRVSSMSQDDGHVFCEPQDVKSEVDSTLEMIREVYRDLGLEGLRIFVATRPDKYIGEVPDWERAEQLLTDAVARTGFECGINPGEGAFYGPKIECYFTDVMGRAWQLGTVQIDMAMPSRFGLRYIGRDGQEHEPAMLHRAVLGSLERFIGIYLEHTAADLPVWLAPIQVNVLPVADRHAGYAESVVGELQAQRVRAELDARNETLNYRVRHSEKQKIPYVLVVGDREQSAGTVTVRRRGQDGQATMTLEELEQQLSKEITTRGIS